MHEQFKHRKWCLSHPHTHSLTLSRPDVRICCDDAILFLLCIKFAYMTMNVKSQQCSLSQRKRIHRCTPTAYYIYKIDDFYVYARVCWHIKFNFCAFLCVSTKLNVLLFTLCVSTKDVKFSSKSHMYYIVSLFLRRLWFHNLFQFCKWKNPLCELCVSLNSIWCSLKALNEKNAHLHLFLSHPSYSTLSLSPDMYDEKKDSLKRLDYKWMKLLHP